MKTLFIPTKLKSKVNKPKVMELSKKLPKNIAIVYSIQYQDIANEIKNILDNDKKITKFVQVLGCSRPIISKNTQAILLIGSGRFHAISLTREIGLPVYVLENGKLSEISKQDVEEFDKRQKVSYVKFLNAEKVGILISTKSGQQNLKKALSLKKKLDKDAYLFIGDNLPTSEFENFGLDSWINTACPRIDMDNSSIINVNTLKFEV